MPIPSPRKDEGKNKFISRCISELSHLDPGRKPDEIQGICYSQWEEKLKEDKNKLKEFEIITDLKEATIDTENMLISNVAILGKYSYDVKGKIRREYSNGALDKFVQVFEGVGAYIDHKEKDRSLTEKYGVYRNLNRKNDTIFGDLDLFDSANARLVMSIAQKDPGSAGNSIMASGRMVRGKNHIIVEEIFPRTRKGFRSSVDMVDDPATTKTIFENKEEEVDYKEIILAEMKTARPDIYEEVLKEGKDSRDEEVTKLTEERDKLKLKVDDFEIKEAQANKKTKVMELLEESKLPKEAQTDIFIETLMKIEAGDKLEEQVKNLIADRKKLIGGVKNNTEHKTETTKEEKEKETDEIAQAVKG